MLLIIRSKIDLAAREKVAEDLKGYIKVVVDVNRKILTAGGEKHVDGEHNAFKRRKRAGRFMGRGFRFRNGRNGF